MIKLTLVPFVAVTSCFLKSHPGERKVEVSFFSFQGEFKTAFTRYIPIVGGRLSNTDSVTRKLSSKSTVSREIKARTGLKRWPGILATRTYTMELLPDDASPARTTLNWCVISSDIGGKYLRNLPGNVTTKVLQMEVKRKDELGALFHPFRSEIFKK